VQPVLFFIILVSYKIFKKTTMSDLRDVWFVRDVPDEMEETPQTGKGRRRNRFFEFLSWVK